MYFFASDQHFSHYNIISYCNRPYNSIGQMNKDLIYKWNKRVAEEDIVYILGDFSFTNRDENKKILHKLNGKKILILGNHDNLDPFCYVADGFRSVHTSLDLNIDGVKLFLNHDPAPRCAIPNDTIFLCGHVHTLFKSIKEQRLVNVGVDVWNYEPITLEEILKELE